MKKFTLVASALFLTYMAQAQPATMPTVTPTVQQSQPKDVAKTLEFTEAEHDFGKIPFGKQAEYQVTIKNISHDSVTLERIQVGCGCTTPKYEANTKIAPNKTYTITLGFNGGTDGAFTKFATLIFSDGMQKQVTFKGETYKTPESSAPANGGTEKMKTGN